MRLLQHIVMENEKREKNKIKIRKNQAKLEPQPYVVVWRKKKKKLDMYLVTQTGDKKNWPSLATDQ